MDTRFIRREPCFDKLCFALSLDRRRMKERIVIGTDVNVQLAMSGGKTADLVYDAVLPLGSLIAHFPHDEKGRWNQYALAPLHEALRVNRWQQPGLEQAAAAFLEKQFAATNPAKKYAALRVWNDYLIARLPRDRETARDHFTRKVSSVTGMFSNPPLTYDAVTGKPKPIDLTQYIGAPLSHTKLELWYPDRQRKTECVVADLSFAPLLTYYVNRLNEWGLCFCKCKVCGKVFLAASLRYELCSEKCKKVQALQNKREFDARARKNHYDLLYKNECQRWRNRIRKAQKEVENGGDEACLEELKARFEAFRKEALMRKKLVKEKKASPQEFADWVFGQEK